MAKSVVMNARPRQGGKTVAWLAVMALAALVMVWGWPAYSHSEAAAILVDIGNASVTYMGSAHDTPEEGQSIWFYRVESGEGPAVSHLTFGVCTSAWILDAGVYDPDTGELFSGEGDPVPTPPTLPTLDPTTNVVGIKFNEGFEDNEVRYYYFVVDYNYSEGYDIPVGVKAGNNEWYGDVIGPACGPSVITLQSIQATAAQNQAALPAVMAALMALLLGVSFIAIKRQ